MQGDYGAALYRQHGINPANPETLIVVDGAKLWRNSDAVLAMYAGLSWPWRAAAALRLIPHFLRDPVYLWVARNRYRWFGRRDVCWIPDPKERERIL